MDDSRYVSNLGFMLTIAIWVMAIAIAVSVVLMKQFPLVGFWATWLRAVMIIGAAFMTLLSLDRDLPKTYNMLTTAAVTVMFVVFGLW